jgi:RHS repeat-associated protein
MTYRLTDGLGSTVNLCDASGSVLVTYAYDAFGAIRSQTGSSANYWQFTGEQRDEESGFDYLRARYYDPEVGRFLGQDPAGGGYAYSLNNPANLTDPTGMVPAGTCLTFSSESHLWVGCSDVDTQGLTGDRWYLDYLSQSAMNGISNSVQANELLELLTPRPAPSRRREPGMLVAVPQIHVVGRRSRATLASLSAKRCNLSSTLDIVHILARECAERC